jgi:multidrug resistance efflux pump
VESEPIDTSTRRAFADLEAFAERSRRADEQTAIIAGMPATIARAVIYLVAAAVVITLAILFFGRVQTVVETTGTILPRGNIYAVRAGQGGVVREVVAALGDSLPAGAVVVRLDPPDTGQATPEGHLTPASVTMPVAGTITELLVKHVGDVVAGGAAIATVVPADAPLFVEATVTNKDVGFLRPGVEARIKVDAFPFQQFGTARARVTRVLPAAGSNGSFVVQLELLDERLTVGDTHYNLFSGLAVQVDLITGRRRMLEVLMQR